MKNIALALILFVFSSTAIAQSQESTAIGYVEIISVENGKAYIRMGSSGATRPSCFTSNHYDYVFELDSATGKALYSQVLSAYFAKLLVEVIPGSACTLDSTIEDISGIILR